MAIRFCYYKQGKSPDWCSSVIRSLLLPETVFGHELQMLKRQKKFFDYVEDGMRYAYHRAHNIFLYNDFLYSLTPSGKANAAVCNEFQWYFDKMVDDGLAGNWMEETPEGGT